MISPPGEGLEFIQFGIRHSEVWLHLSLIALCGALGQLFIFLMVAGFGPLACSVVTTTRKFFTVLCSVLLFGNVLIARQWLGAILVFAALFTDMLFGKKQNGSTNKKPPSDNKIKEEQKKLIS